MKKNLIYLVLGIFYVTGCQSTVDQEIQKDTSRVVVEKVIDNDAYLSLSEKTLNGDEVDFTELRSKFYNTDYYNVYDSATVKELQELINSGELETALKVIDENIQYNIAELKFVYYAHLVFRKLENPKLEFTKYVLSNLLEVIALSGDGQNPETAYHVISTAEEYVFMGVYGVDYGDQSLIEHGSSVYDMFQVTPNENYGFEEIYFNVDKVFEEYNLIF